ncbi:MAG: hypothetical protein ACYC0V_08565 [Armatimonadota bacterium]
MKRIVLILISLGLLACVIAYTMHASSRAVYKVTDLGTLNGYRSEAIDINNAGQIAGNITIRRGDHSYQHAFLWEKGVMKDLGTMEFEESIAVGIGEKGQVIGILQDKGHRYRNDRRGFIWQNGRMVKLALFDGFHTIPATIDDEGRIIGYLVDDKAKGSRFIWEDGKFRHLDAGYDKHLPHRHGYPGHKAIRLPNGKIIALGSFRGDDGYTLATDMNKDGVAIGISETSKLLPPIGSHDVEIRLTEYVTKPFVWSDGRMYDLNSLLPAFSERKMGLPNGINDGGQIVGKSKGKYGHAMLLTPVRPLPR